MRKTYRPSGVCSQMMDIEVEDGVIKYAAVYGGCDGNLQAVTRLVTGMTVENAIEKLSGIRCGGKPTSCPDQLAKALRDFM